MVKKLHWSKLVDDIWAKWSPLESQVAPLGFFCSAVKDCANYTMRYFSPTLQDLTNVYLYGLDNPMEVLSKIIDVDDDAFYVSDVQDDAGGKRYRLVSLATNIIRNYIEGYYDLAKTLEEDANELGVELKSKNC